jgi:CRISPR/Cas system endoribonuclease Cas6 (RAMP superfamily)
LDQSENFLQALINNKLDKNACQYAKKFMKNINQDLMVFCIEHQSEIFLKYALNEALFPSDYLSSEKSIVRDKIFELLESNSKTEFVLNILLFSNFKKWP